MSNTIRQNMPMLGVIRQHRANEKMRNTAMERISSGLEVNSAKDNVQYDAMAKRLTADLRTNEVGMLNIADGISMLNTRDAYLSKMVDFVTEMKKCAMRGVNGGADSGDHAVLTKQILALNQEVKVAQERASFNGQHLFNKGIDSTSPLQVQLNNAKGIVVDKRGDLVAALLTAINFEQPVSNHITANYFSVTEFSNEELADYASDYYKDASSTPVVLSQFTGSLNALDTAQNNFNNARADVIKIQFADNVSDHFDITVNNPELIFTLTSEEHPVLDNSAFQQLMDDSDSALQKLNLSRTQVGIEINILESINDSLREINLIDTKARSGLIDADISEEFASLSSANALIAAAQFAMGELKDSQAELVRSLSR